MTFQTISQKLRDENVRLTKPRTLVIDILLSQSKPLSADEIFEYCNTKIDRTSVYRTLSLLEEKRVVQVVEFGERHKYYSLIPNEDEHVHYIRCTRCSKVETVDFCIVTDIEKKTGYTIQAHSMEFRGVCKGCQH